MSSSKKRMLQAFAGIADDNLKALAAEIVQIYSESTRERQPRAAYRAKVDSYARELGNEFLDEIDSSEPPPTDGAPVRNKGAEGLISLQELTLCNFGSYRGSSSIDLTGRSPERNVVVVVGSNGDGKSTLFYALNWALYGEDYLQELERDKGRTLASLFNRGALEEAGEVTKSLSMSVRLSFQVRGIDYYVLREAMVNVDEGVISAPQLQPTKLRKVDASGNHTDLLPGALDGILSTLPKHVRDFYFFDGEQINKFVSPGSRVHIRSAIRRVMGIDALEGAIEGISRVAADIRSEVRKHSTGQMEQVAAQQEAAHDKLAAARQEVKGQGDNLATLDAAIKKLDEMLESVPDARPYQANRTRLERELKDLSKAQEKLNYSIRELAHESSLLLASSSVSKLVADLDERRQAGVIPGPINRTLLQDLLKAGVCICGTNIESGTAARQHIEHTLGALQVQAATGEKSLELFFELTGLDRALIRRAADLDKARKDLDELYERQRSTRQALMDAEAELAGVAVVDRSGWENERQQKRELERKAAHAKGAAELEVTTLSQEIKKLQELEKQIAISNSRVAELTVRRNWAEAAENALRFVHDHFAAAARQDVEVSTVHLWNDLLPTVQRYKVSVSADFELQVCDEQGNPAMQDLSMGQQQCLGLSFITAVAQVAEARPPLVIDMPFGRLGVDVASSVAETLPQLTEQLILFVLPETEWNEQTKTAVSPYLSREYGITYDAKAQSTSIAEMALA